MTFQNFLVPEVSGKWTRRKCAGSSRCGSACTIDDSAGVDSVRENRRMIDAASLVAWTRSAEKLVTITMEIARRRRSTASIATPTAVASAAGRMEMRAAARWHAAALNAGKDVFGAWPAEVALRALAMASGSVPGARSGFSAVCVRPGVQQKAATVRGCATAHAAATNSIVRIFGANMDNRSLFQNEVNTCAARALGVDGGAPLEFALCAAELLCGRCAVRGPHGTCAPARVRLYGAGFGSHKRIRAHPVHLPCALTRSETKQVMMEAPDKDTSPVFVISAPRADPPGVGSGVEERVFLPEPTPLPARFQVPVRVRSHACSLAREESHRLSPPILVRGRESVGFLEGKSRWDSSRARVGGIPFIRHLHISSLALPPVSPRAISGRRVPCGKARHPWRQDDH